MDMKKIIGSFLLAIGIVIFFCCTTSKNKGDNYNMYINEVETFVIDSCEYIGKQRGYDTDFLIHKGNCKFCKLRLK